MKSNRFRFTLFSIIVYLACLNAPSVSALTSEGKDVHFCLFDEWHQDNRRFARSPAYDAKNANLNVGEPRTVRLVYFLPNDRPYRPAAVQNMKNEIRTIQTFYAAQMKAHGYGLKTFRVETDAQNEPMVHRVDGQHPENHYFNDVFSTLIDEIGRTFDFDANIYLIVFDNSSGAIGRYAGRLGGLGRRMGKNGGFAIVPDPYDGPSTHIMAHELGHAFGLYHDFNNRTYLMSYGAQPQSQLSACHAEFLAAHPYFNLDVAAQAGQPPTIELISTLTYPAGSQSVSVELKLRDSDGLHQVFLFNRGFFEVWGCRGLAGNKDSVVKFDYDGYSGYSADRDNVVGLSDSDKHRITVMAVDTDGNVYAEEFVLSEIEGTQPRPQTLEIISGDNQQGPAYAQLVQPLVVEVRDQNNNPLPNALVTFTVIAGEGKLSGLYTLENALTDASGRAEKTLTVGAGRTIVEITAAVNRFQISRTGESPTKVIFNAIGVGPPMASIMNGDYQKWHLPDGATIRLGKGLIGASDRAVAYSPDGQLLAVASSIGVWIYDAATSRELALLPSPRRTHSVAFSTNGKKLAAGVSSGLYTSGAVVLWDIATKTQIASLAASKFSANITSVSFSPDDGTIAFRSDFDEESYGPVKLWHVATGNVTALEDKFRQENGGISLTDVGRFTIKPLSVAFSPDGTLLASGSPEGTVELWEVETQTLRAALSGHKLRVSSVAFSRDGRLLASGSSDETVKLWDVLKKENIATFRGHRHEVSSVAFSHDGRLLASGAHGFANATIKLWDVATERNINTFGPLQWGVNAVAFSPDDRTLASGSTDGTVKLWNVATGNVEHVISEHTNVGRAVSFSPDGRTLASGSTDGTVKLWDVTSGRNLDTFGIHQSRVDAVAFSPDGTLLASGSYDRTVKIWDVETGTSFASKFTCHCGGQVSSVAFSRDGTILASGDFTAALLWNTATGTQLSTPFSYASFVSSVSFSPNPNSSILAFGSDFGVKLWDVATHTPITSLGEAFKVNSVAFSPDGTVLAAATHDLKRPITLWNVLTKEKIGSFGKSQATVKSLSFSPDGTILAFGAANGTIDLWDLATQIQLATLEGHGGLLGDISVSIQPTNSAVLASGFSGDGTVLLWDISQFTSSGPELVDEIIPDRNLRTAIVAALGKTSSDKIIPAEMLMLTDLDARGKNIANLTGLEFATNLTSLYLPSNSISDISSVSHLTKLKSLDLENNSISDFSAVSGLTNLTSLRLANNSISEISAVSGLTKLKALTLSDNSVSDISAVSGLTNLTFLTLNDNSISNISALTGLTNLKSLHIYRNSISDISALTGLTNLKSLFILGNSISDISALTGLTNLTNLDISYNSISDISPLVANAGLGGGDEVDIRANQLSYASIQTHIQTLQSRGVTVKFDNQAHPALLKISGDDQTGPPGDALEKPFVVEAQDENGSALEGVTITFTVTAGSGMLSTTLTTTDVNGRAESILTLGIKPGTTTVKVSVLEIQKEQTFTAIAEPPRIPQDVNGDNLVDILDLVLVASAIGDESPNLAADVNADGVVDLLDLVSVARAFGDVAAAPSSQAPETLTTADVREWLTAARSLVGKDAVIMRGIVALEQLLAALTPGETALLPNFPNPFNPETWIPYQLAEDAEVTLTIYNTKGVTLRRLDLGYRLAGYYSDREKAAYWDGRNDNGEPVASGLYFYELATPSFRQLRRMVILK